MSVAVPALVDGGGSISNYNASRFLYGYGLNLGFLNSTINSANNFTSQLKPVSDLSTTTVLTTFYLNTLVFFFLMILYEVLRRHFPDVYAARKQRLHRKSGTEDPAAEAVAGLPEVDSPLGWLVPVFLAPWATVRKIGGLDAYFFLRYIRMCLRITGVSTFWAAVILCPVFITGKVGEKGWYLISMANLAPGDWRTWVPGAFIYLFSFFCFFVMKQEYEHYMQLRMDFLGRDDRHLHPQHHYSLMVENIPMELRSDVALFDYFERLFPGKVHSASVIVNLPDLEGLSARRKKVVRRLEKAVALYYSKNERPTHHVGGATTRCCRLRAPLGGCCSMCKKSEPVVVDESDPLPPRGTLVDSISFYTRELIECNHRVLELQQRKRHVVETGNQSTRGGREWFSNIISTISEAAARIMDDSEQDNCLQNPDDSLASISDSLPLAERMTSFYGSFVGASLSDVGARSRPMRKRIDRMLREESMNDDNGSIRLESPRAPPKAQLSLVSSDGSDRTARLLAEDRLAIPDEFIDSETKQKAAALNDPGYARLTPEGEREKGQTVFRRVLGRFGLDFAATGLTFFQKQLDMLLAEVVGSRMSSTGFVTFLDLASLTSAVSVPLTHKPSLFEVSVAPEPRDIRWNSAHIAKRVITRRENYVNVLLALGVVLWSFPLTAIQLFATAKELENIPGLAWLFKFDGGRLTGLINGYLPVLALLSLILVLPIIFEWIAVHYENRKTHSEVQRSVLFRYFYYQVANVYITVTAGSLWVSLEKILNNPTKVFQILGESLPTLVGYFIALLITKIMAGLPIIVLRGGALSRKLLVRMLFSTPNLTQRELDEIYRAENLLYGWEYPMLLLVIVICFTYACICPIILPFGAGFFALSMLVYKKQVLYVYTPVFESGGAMFPLACDCTLFGLICGQVTLIGYATTRHYLYVPVWMLPLPIITLWVMLRFRHNYAIPSNRLSMERAIGRDLVADVKAAVDLQRQNYPGIGREVKRDLFDKTAYRQPVLTEGVTKPLSYRQGTEDKVTDQICDVLRKHNDKLSAKGDKFMLPSYEEDDEDDDESEILSTVPNVLRA